MATGDGVLALVVQKLADFIVNEATFLLGVKDDVVFIKDELSWMESFLKDAEERQGNDERIRLWVAEIKHIAYKIGDIIDDYYIKFNGKEPSKRKLFTTSLRKCCCIAPETNVYDIGKEIQTLKERLFDISRKREVYGIQSISNNAQEMADVASQNQLLQDLRRTTSLANEENFVGFGDDIALLEIQLLSPDPRLDVISILGMGGLGKTTLVRKLYNTNKCVFEVHGWVCVSQQWNTKDLLARIIKSIRNPTNEELNTLEKMNDDDLKRELHKLLKNKRYILVIDDIWDEKAWECLKSALPGDQTKSRIIITTRIKSVAWLSNKRTYVHELRRLRKDESWALFCMKAFPIRNSVSENIGKEMVAKCDGLPLAIIVLGGLLSVKEYNEWGAIKTRMWKELIENDKLGYISALMDLSYNDLSPKLRCCFLYLGIFPEDHVIRSEKLVNLWIAEDLIPQSQGQDLEEVAESYIKELGARSLIQLNENDFGSGSTCRVHDLLRDLAVDKAKSLVFFQIYGESMKPDMKPLSTKRIAFRSRFERYKAIDDRYHTQVHTISFLNYEMCFNDDNVTKLITLINTRFKSLRVLDLEGVKIETRASELKLFEALGKLVHLRYLGLFQANIDESPESIENQLGNLRALQNVDAFNILGDRILLPLDIYKLAELRHLKGYFKTKKGNTIVPPTSFQSLSNLHTLNEIDISGWLINEASDELALQAFSGLYSIKNLFVSFEDANYRLSIEPLFHCRNLFELVLSGSIKSLPMELHSWLPKLRYLYLYNASFVQDPLPALEKLPNLLFLGLSGFKLEKLFITAKGFCVLVTLLIRDIPLDMNLQIEEDALPCLKHIHIDPLMNFTLPARFNRCL